MAVQAGHCIYPLAALCLKCLSQPCERQCRREGARLLRRHQYMRLGAASYGRCRK